MDTTKIRKNKQFNMTEDDSVNICFVDLLPQELLLSIFFHVGEIESGRLNQTCKKTNTLVNI